MLQTKKKKSPSPKIVIFVVVFLILIIANHKFMVHMGLNKAERDFDRTINYTKEALDAYDASLSTDEETDLMQLLFKGMMINQSSMMVVCQDGRVIAGNSENIDPDFALEIEDLVYNAKLVDENLYRIKYQEKRWYLRQIQYKDYEVYLMLSVPEIYRSYYVIDLVIIAFYLLICGIVSAILADTERKRLAHQNKYYQIIDAVNQAYTGNLLIHIDDKTAEWIKQPDDIRERLHGYTDAESIILDIADVYVADSYRKEFLQFADFRTLQERLENKKSLSYIYEDVLEQWIALEIVTQQVDPDGNIAAVLYLIRNVTDEMEKEKEYQKRLKVAGDAKTNFLRRMSHDIRTPINGIQGIIEIAGRDPDNIQKQREYWEKIGVATGYLLDLVNNILDMSKLESGDVKLEHKPFDLREILEKSNEIVMMQCSEWGITYHVQEGEIRHRKLIGSPVHFQQVLMNIASNAVKYNHENGSITVCCREISNTDDEAVFELSCEDTGIGMSEEFQKHIFEPFSQEEDDARSKYAGSGLGMAITKELVDLQGGSISLSSTEGVGTKFVVKIPFEIDHSAAKTDTRTTEDVAQVLDGAHILLVEDNELNMEIAEYFLVEKGAQVTKAWNGQEAVDIFAKSEPGDFQLIIMDIMMPVLNGLDATKKIRRMQRRDAETIPIIAMTANAFQDDVESSMRAGMNAHITKPLDMDIMLKTIHDLLKR